MTIDFDIHTREMIKLHNVDIDVENGMGISLNMEITGRMRARACPVCYVLLSRVTLFTIMYPPCMAEGLPGVLPSTIDDTIMIVEVLLLKIECVCNLCNM